MSKENGGKRCDYADQVANARRKALYKFRDDYDAPRKAKAAVNAWKEANKELVVSHLPSTQPFNAQANKKPIPESLQALLTQKARDSVMGLPEEERLKQTRELYEARKVWFDALTKGQDSAVSHYAMNFFEGVNSHLRKEGYSAWLKANSHLYNKSENTLARVKEDVRNLDTAIKLAPIPEEPRKLYRFFRVPAGVTPHEYMERYFKTGEGFKEKGYMSTTADPEFVMGHMWKQNKGTKNHGYVVMEIITKQGASLQNRATSSSGDVQSLEKEILLPRNMKLRIASTRKSQRFEFASDRKDLDSQYNNSYSTSNEIYQRWGAFKKGDRMNFPLIQMIDEDLIAKTS
jgi:hypothetical protein